MSYRSLFSPVHVNGLTYQDGGMRQHNNPVNLALWESRVVWPHVDQPDVVVSLGTGTEIATSPKASEFRHIFKDGFIPRLYRSFKSSLDGQLAWNDLWNRLSERSRQDYFRLNIPCPGSESSPDDVGAMDNLSQRVKVSPSGPSERREVLSALLVSCFFFELSEPPQYENGVYYCVGSIRARISGHGLLRAVFRLHGKYLEFYKDNESLGCFLDERDICDMCHCYRRRIRFIIRRLEESFTLCLKWDGTSMRKLSAFPQALDWFIGQQRLESHFGNSNHGAPGSVRCTLCTASDRREVRSVGKGQKRLRSPTSPKLKHKKASRLV